MHRIILHLALAAAALAAAALAASGCGRSLLDRIAAPDLGSSTPIPPVPLSTIAIPVRVDLKSIAAQAESVVPRELRTSDWSVVSANAVGDLGIRYEAWRDPLSVTMSGDRIAVGARLHYRLEAAQRVPKPIVGGSFWQPLASCGKGEPPREALLGLQTTIAWNADWQLVPSTSVVPATFPNKCRITFLKIDVTDKVDEAFAAGLRNAAGLADRAIREQGNLRPLAERTWKQLQEPVRLDSTLWMTLNPESASAAPVTGAGTSATTSLLITARPTVRFGGRPQAVARPLPGLRQAPAADGFHVAVDGAISFEEATAQLARAFRGKPQKVGSRMVTIDSIRMFGSGDMGVLELRLSGDVEGTLYLAGRPVYDEKNGVLSIADLDYSLETKQVLARVADWLYHGSFTETIAGQARLALNRKISEARREIERSLNRTLVAGSPGAVLVGRVSGVRPVGVYVTRDGLVARVLVDGTLSVDVK